MPDTPSAHEIFDRLIRGITDGHWRELGDLYADNAVVEMPFAAPAPTRIEGREAVRRHFAAAAGLPLTLEARNVVVHETADPEVIIAEYDYRGRATATGRSFEVANIQVLTVRDGRIVASRDYHRHGAFAEALG
jgi:ketosteroid isomerase-like protein